MSTRAVIARTTDAGRTFRGVYHHWDGYPSGLGATLWRLYRGHFSGRADDMLQVLIDDHPAGWSNILGADWSLPPAPQVDHNLEPCGECTLPQWMHYGQYYSGPSGRSTAAAFQRLGIKRALGTDGGAFLVLGHHAKIDREKPHGAVCLSPREPDHTDPPTDQENAPGCGCEWAYCFAREAGEDILYVLASICGPGKFHGEKMAGAFGVGDRDATWIVAARVEIANAPEPDWEALNSVERVEVLAEGGVV
jgi:hypothetical protein